MARKLRPTAVDEFLRTVPEETLIEFYRLADLPNVSVKELYNLLVGLGFDSSLTSCYRWYSHRKKEGQHAKAINKALTSYEGIDADKVLEKLVCTLHIQLDKAIEILETNNLSAKEYLQSLPNLARELRGTISSKNQMEYIKQRQELEIAGVIYAQEQLKKIFSNQPFAIAVNDALSAVIQEMQEK